MRPVNRLTNGDGLHVRGGDRRPALAEVLPQVLALLAGADLRPLLVLFPSGRYTIRLTVETSTGHPDAAALVDDTLPASQARAAEDLATLRAIGDEVLLAKEIARRLGVPNRTPIRTRLARLRRDGLLLNHGRGYFLSDAGRDQLKGGE
jgi:hypothetical protein